MKRLDLKALMAATAIVLTGSCSSSDELNNNSGNNSNNNNEEVPVTFGSYLGGSANTRAGVTGDMSTTSLQKDGFGVFAYYTRTSTYQQERKTATPNFMYNTQVTSTDGSAWTYSPLRYWPNDNVSEDGTAQSQYVSFFTYAPYVSNLSGTETSGITSLPANTAAGDPIIGYSTQPGTDGNSVDLLWGTANNSGNAAKPSDGSATTIDMGKAYTADEESTDANATKVDADMTKQKISGQVKFNFKHALAKFGGYSKDPESGSNKTGVTVDLIADGVNASKSGVYDNTKTRVTIKYINIKVQNAPASTDAKATTLKTSGKFNLVTGSWTLDDAATDATDFIQSINSKNASDNKATATVTTDLATSLAEPAANTTLVSEGAWSTTAMPEGVTETAKNVYTSDAKSLYVLPGQTPRFVVTICYVVRTLDPSLAAGYTEVEQTISKNVDFTKAVALNKQYNLAIHLGLTSVKFDATVEDWDAGQTSSSESSDASQSQSIDMPLNVE